MYQIRENGGLSVAIVVAAGLVAAAYVWTPRTVSALQEEPHQRTITVTGEADVNVVPDEVVLSSSIETWDRDLTRAKEENDRRIRRAFEVVQRAGIETKHFQTGHISIYRRNRDAATKESGFAVSKALTVTLKDMSKFERLLSDLLENGVNSVQGIEFRTSELRKHRDRARAMALRTAREKAIAMAGELDQQIDRTTTITEESSSAWGWGRGYSNVAQNAVQVWNGEGIESGNTIAPGQLTVKARVVVAFELK